MSAASSSPTKSRFLFAIPTRTELNACWELGRLSNGMGCWVCWFPLAFSMAMAYHAMPDLPGWYAAYRGILFIALCCGVKCLIMTIDDILDADVDALVERTKNRVLPRGDITMARAWLFFAIQSVVGAGLAYAILKPYTLYISMLVWPLFVIYPTCKRWMSFAPLPLAVMFNIGALMGWSDLAPGNGSLHYVLGEGSPAAGRVPFDILLPLFFGCCCWTVTFETVYQHQDKADDVAIGLRSLAIFCGKATVAVCALTTLGFGGLLAWAFWLNGQGIAAFVGLALGTLRLLNGLRTVDIDYPRSCLQFFLLTPGVGVLVLLGLIADGLLWRWQADIPL
ncbi:UbiA prenyltransferase [Schizophyllum commune Loenen D]|nr:UbiA prenyltransferase [Schizophyllum commune Loenen D]